MKTQGTVAEEWLKDLAGRHGILNSKVFSLEKVAPLLNTKLQSKLTLARPYLDRRYADASQWLNTILLEHRKAHGSAQEKTELAAWLLDLCVATDVILSLRDDRGQEQVIAVDVTTNPNLEGEKLDAIRGKKDPNDPPNFNRNKNLPEVRRELEINKHLVLIVNPDRFPEPEVLLGHLYAFANAPAKTGSLDLWVPTPELSSSPEQAATPPPTPQQLWHHYSQGGQQTNLAHIIRTAKVDGQAPEMIARILDYHPSYQSLAQKARPENAQRYNAALVERELEQQKRQALWAAGVIRVVLSLPDPKVQGQPDGSVALQGKSFEYRQQAEMVSLAARDGRGEILRVNGDQVEVDKLTGQDLTKCRKVQEQIVAYQQAAQKKDAQQKNGNGPAR